jgi:hypothetical protein
MKHVNMFLATLLAFCAISTRQSNVSAFTPIPRSFAVRRDVLTSISLEEGQDNSYGIAKSNSVLSQFHILNHNNVHLGKRTQCRERVICHGIPKMFRWLTDQYPNVNRRLSEGLSRDTEVDNFYLDMNGIIHPCTHGNSDSFVALDETAMFKKIFGYVDR